MTNTADIIESILKHIDSQADLTDDVAEKSVFTGYDGPLTHAARGLVSKIPMPKIKMAGNNPKYKDFRTKNGIYAGKAPTKGDKAVGGFMQKWAKPKAAARVVSTFRAAKGMIGMKSDVATIAEIVKNIDENTD